MAGPEREPASKERLVRKTKETEFKPPKEVEGWLERLEKDDTQLTKPVLDDQGQVLVTSPMAQKPKISLPLEKEEFIVALKQGVTEAVRWLAEWCFRMIKMKPGKVVFKKKDDQ